MRQFAHINITQICDSRPCEIGIVDGETQCSNPAAYVTRDIWNGRGLYWCREHIGYRLEMLSWEAADLAAGNEP